MYTCVQTAVKDKCGNVRPLDEEHLRSLRSNCAYLVGMINLRDRLLDEMMSDGCITHQQNDAIREMIAVSAEKNRQLLDVLSRRSVAHYNEFLNCLRCSGQGFIADVLELGDGEY